MREMKKLSDEEFLGRMGLLEKRHRSDWCRLVYEGIVGRSMQELATLSGYSRKWVSEHLDRYALESASGGGGDSRPLQRGGSDTDIKSQVAKVVSKYAPKEPCQEYVEEYEAEGHTPEVAKRLAMSYEATESAIEKGVVREAKGKRDEKLMKIVLPDGVDWSMKLRRACADVKCAAKMLDGAKISDLKRAVTRDQIASAHAKWMEQMELLSNFHETFNEKVASHEES
jgi:hypothetical protein